MNSKTCANKAKRFGKSLFRRKPIDSISLTDSGDLSRCLTTFDLTNLGIGSILGAGIYVVVGQVATNIAGPSIVISLAIAAFTSLLSGMCYAEFASRVPRTTGSAYAYSYHTVGELIAFVIGWNLILEYMIGTAADARALSGAVDYLLDHRISNFTTNLLGVVPLTGAVPDLLGFLLTMTVTMVLAVGVKESARYTIFFNVLTGAVAIFIICAGSVEADPSNWASKEKFFPNGAHGVLSGAATCFYAYVGYDIIATTGEEARSPSKSIPLAMALTLIVCFSAYVGVASVVTMMVPFGSLRHSDSPITAAFDMATRGGTPTLHKVSRWLVGLGGVAGMSASLMGSEFPLPRIIYAMSADGLLFRFLSRVWTRTEVPMYATILPGLMTAFFTMLFDLGELVEMMSIGTLLAYSLVCTSVLLLRYRAPSPSDQSSVNGQLSTKQNQEKEDDVLFASQDESYEKLLISESQPNLSAVSINQSVLLVNRRRHGRIILSICFIWLLSIGCGFVSLFGEKQLLLGNIAVVSLLAVMLLGIIVCMIWLACQPQDRVTLDKLHFKVPLVPLVPVTAILFNIILMMRLSYITWIRFVVWLTLGFMLYFGYGVWHSRIYKDVSAAGRDGGARYHMVSRHRRSCDEEDDNLEHDRIPLIVQATK